MLEFWAARFLARQPDHFVFPSERYGAGGDAFQPCTYATDPTKPITSWKTGWVGAKKKAGVTIRFHDLRHTGVTRMLEGGAPLAVVASLMGWSAGTTVRMAKRYGHIGQVAQRQAVELLDRVTVGPRQESHANSPSASRPN